MGCRAGWKEESIEENGEKWEGEAGESVIEALWNGDASMDSSPSLKED